MLAALFGFFGGEGSDAEESYATALSPLSCSLRTVCGPDEGGESAGNMIVGGGGYFGTSLSGGARAV